MNSTQFLKLLNIISDFGILFAQRRHSFIIGK